jgi:hypothetical protein
MFGIPVGLVSYFREEFSQKQDAVIALSFSPQIDSGHMDWQLIGGAKFRVNSNMLSTSNRSMEQFEITCRPINQRGLPNESSPRDLSALVFRVLVSTILIDGKDPFLEITLEPRASISNNMPVSVGVQTPMPHVFSLSQRDLVSGEDVIHAIERDENVQIFSPGPSVAVILKIANRWWYCDRLDFWWLGRSPIASRISFE